MLQDYSGLLIQLFPQQLVMIPKQPCSATCSKDPPSFGFSVAPFPADERISSCSQASALVLSDARSMMRIETSKDFSLQSWDVSKSQKLRADFTNVVNLHHCNSTTGAPDPLALRTPHCNRWREKLRRLQADRPRQNCRPKHEAVGRRKSEVEVVLCSESTSIPNQSNQVQTSEQLRDTSHFSFELSPCLRYSASEVW